MGQYTVTQGEYANLVGTNPSLFTAAWGYGDDLSRPVEALSWEDATNYCGLLTQRERAAGRIPTNCVYRLPTEAEWEYACRAWTSTRFSYGDDPGFTNLTDYAWYVENSDGMTHPVGQKLPNPWGLYDMHGNVEQWCQDFEHQLPGGIVLDPSSGPATSADFHKLRGSPYVSLPFMCRSAWRNTGAGPSGTSGGPSWQGMRVVMAPGD